MFNPTDIPKQFKVFSIQPDLRISFSGPIWSKMFFSIFLLPFVALFVGHLIFICLGLYEILHLDLEKAIDFFSYGTNNFWYLLMFVFTFSLLSVATWYWLWVIFGFHEIRATEESLTTISKMLGMSWKKSVLTKEIRYFNQFLKRDGEGDTWDLEIVTNQKLFDKEQSYPRGASQFCNFTKILIVIANAAKRNEAIAKSSYCDCFASFHYARNDKLYFSTFGMLPIRVGFHKSGFQQICWFG
ncbi:hypothetical protein NIES267_16500 [Calothrix parasitica NIES-267]|uniref:Uncharacterized protein n=1 Tax=Calothrix parasitica NIES-267 TaxID=1973488 RepID=A0A1Z4LLP7_9CYAN|nr:hypothetical protein NIES267_16500 [Calothrix parasitica NIES-267]